MSASCKMIGVSALALAFSVVSVHATQLTSITGEVRVNQGSGFKLGRAAMPLNPGDQVIAQPDGAAVVTYDDGAQAVVRPGQVLTVAPSGGATPGAAGAAGEGAGAAAAGADAGITATTLGVAAVAAGAVGAAIVLSKSTGHSP